jgi:hypothetical protein
VVRGLKNPKPCVGSDGGRRPWRSPRPTSSPGVGRGRGDPASNRANNCLPCRRRCWSTQTARASESRCRNLPLVLLADYAVLCLQGLSRIYGNATKPQTVSERPGQRTLSSVAMDQRTAAPARAVQDAADMIGTGVCRNPAKGARRKARATKGARLYPRAARACSLVSRQVYRQSCG